MQLVIYVLLYPILYLISILPFRILYAFSDFLYLIIFRVFGYRKKVVIANLKLVYPDKSEKELKQITKLFYHHLCDMMVESIKSITISAESMRAHFSFKNIELIKELEAKNRSIVLMCAHYGSWEWIFILQTYVSHKGYAVYKKLSNPYFDKLFKRVRAKYNSHLITTKETIPTLIKSKENGELTINGFVSDQSPRIHKTHHWGNFMGIDIPVFTGAEMLAKKLDMSVVFFKVKRLKRGYYETTFELMAENPLEYPDYEITDDFLKRVEKQIHEAPQYYLWTHKRWKHRNKNKTTAS